MQFESDTVKREDYLVKVLLSMELCCFSGFKYVVLPASFQVILLQPLDKLATSKSMKQEYLDTQEKKRPQLN